MKSKSSAPPEIIKAIGILLVIPLFAIATIAFGILGSFAALAPSILIIFALTPSKTPPKKIGIIDKIIYLIIAVLSATLAFAIISISS